MKIAVIIPVTSNKCNFISFKDTDLFNILFKSFFTTYNLNLEYKFYLGIDSDDNFYQDNTVQNDINKFINVMKNTSIEFLTIDSSNKGNVCFIWNELFKKAYDDNYDYFYQCGDDIVFRTKGWINDSIKMLKSKNNIGLTGPINNNNRILTQSFVSRKHMEIFGWYFPEEIKNWCCDDWYNMVYHPNYLYPLNNHFAENNGGAPRYDINNDKKFNGGGNQMVFSMNVKKLRASAQELANKHKKLIEKYINNNK